MCLIWAGWRQCGDAVSTFVVAHARHRRMNRREKMIVKEASRSALGRAPSFPRGWTPGESWDNGLSRTRTHQPDGPSACVLQPTVRSHSSLGLTDEPIPRNSFCCQSDPSTLNTSAFCRWQMPCNIGGKGVELAIYYTM